jgi:hypothetical protein
VENIIYHLTKNVSKNFYKIFRKLPPFEGHLSDCPIFHISTRFKHVYTIKTSHCFNKEKSSTITLVVHENNKRPLVSAKNNHGKIRKPEVIEIGLRQYKEALIILNEC